MTNPLFSGVCTALVTPFLGDVINFPMVEQLLKRQICAGIPAVALAGTTGESPTLSDSEKIALFQFGKQCVGNACKIVAGTGSNSTAHAVALSQAAEKAGADALLVVTPYYNKATDDGLIAHYRAIAQAVTIPIILYNVPSRTGFDISIDCYKRLSQIPNIIGTKEAGTNVSKVVKIRNVCGDHFSIWSGNDDLTVPFVSLGASGVISVISNVFPEETNHLVNAALNGDYTLAAAMQADMQAYMDAMFLQVNPVPVKAAMKLIGYDCGDCRLPLSPPSQATYETLYRLLT